MAWQLAKAMRKKRISKARMAVLLKTSRSQVDRILDPKRDITLSSLQRAAALVGQRVGMTGGLVIPSRKENAVLPENATTHRPSPKRAKPR